MAKTLDAILAELDASYSPQRQSIQQRIDALPAQADAEIGGLKAQQTQAFDDILAGARSRNLGFSGIPLGEQAKYTSTQFLPAVARVRQSQNEAKQSLFDALNNVNLEQRKTGMGLYQQELDRDEQIRQFNESLAEQKRQAAQQSSVYSGLFNGGGQQAPTQQVDPYKQKAQADVGNLLTKDNNRIRQEYLAIKASAGYGNTYDQLKLQLLEYLRPELKNTRGNTVQLGKASPTQVPLNPTYSGLSVGVANPNVRIR